MKRKLVLLAVLMVILGTFTVDETFAGCYGTDPATIDVIAWNIVEKGCVRTSEDDIKCIVGPSASYLTPGVDWLTIQQYRQMVADDEIDPSDYSYHTLLGVYIEKSVPVSGPRNLFSKKGSDIYLITFYSDEMDLYGEVEIGWVEQYTKTYAIRPLYIDKKDGYLTTGGGATSVDYYADLRFTFFVCEEHSICGECDKYVASNGATFEQTGYKGLEYINVNRNCAEEHACLFFWVTSNTNNKEQDIWNKAGEIGSLTYQKGTFAKTIEGLKCLEKPRLEKDGGKSYFCEDHTCNRKNCFYPIIGVNLHDGAIKEPEINENDNPELYSKYCIVHFCWDRFCREARANERSQDPEKDETTGYCYKFAEYCSEHYNNHYMDCTKYKCTNYVVNDDFENDDANGNRYLCPTHMAEEVRPLVICDGCKKSIQVEFTVSFGEGGPTLCDACLMSAKNGVINVNMNDGSVVTVFVDSGNTSNTGNGNGNGNSSGACNHLEQPVPTSVWFQALGRNTHLQHWKCENCGIEVEETYNHIYRYGRCVCGDVDLTYKGNVVLPY